MQSVALILKRAFWGIFLCLALLSFPLPSFALTVQDVPNPRQVYGGWVTDMANLLDPATKVKLNQIISKLEAENGTEIAVVTVPDTAPSATAKQFATQLFNYWGIGKRGINNGVLFLISKDERRVEIKTGYGIEKILQNARVGNIINQLIIPHFKQDDFGGGTLAGIQALIKDLERRDILPITKPITSKHQPNSQAYLASFLVIVLIVVLIGAGIVWSICSFVDERVEVVPRKFPRKSTQQSHRKSSDDSSSGDCGGSSWDSDGGSSWGGDSGGFGGGDSGGGGDGGSW